MLAEESLFHTIGESISESVKGQLFGKSCYKIGGKAFVCFFENEMVFKLSGENHTEGLDLSGSQLFDPSKKKRPMKEWVQIPYIHNEKWSLFANYAAEYITSILRK